MKYRKLWFKLILVFGLLFIPGLCQAMPPGTLLYRTSGDGKMFGYSQDPLIYSEKGIIKNIYSGHAAIYIGKENGQDYIVEAMSGGIVKNPAKYFVNRADGETFLGARIPTAVNALQQARVVALAKSLVGKNLDYDFDFHIQKGPESGEWTCVGLTEKLYESANVFNPNNLGALEYDPNYYAVDITPDGFDNESVANSSGDCFSRNREFSKIARRTDILVPAPELIGYDVGLEHEGNRYIFLPYTQFLQPTLTPVAADVEISSSFSREEVNGPLNLKALVARWSLINNPLSSLKAIGTAIKETAIKVVAKTKELAQNLSGKIFNSGSGTSIAIIDDNLQKVAGTSTPKKSAAVKKTVSVKKAAAAKITSTAKTSKTAAKTAATKNTAKSSSDKDGASQTAKTNAIKASVNKNDTVKASIAKTSASSTSVSKSKASTTAVAAANQVKAVNQAYYNPAVSNANAFANQGSGSGGSSSGGSSAGNSSPSAVDNYPKLAKINKIYSTGDNDWVEIINATDHDFDLAAAGYRLEKTKSAEDPSLLMRIGDIDDGSYPGGTIVKAHDTYLIVSGNASNYYKQKADALVAREGFSWSGSGYTLYLGTGVISSSDDTDIVDAVGFGAEATYFLGSGPAPEISDNHILQRASSTNDNALDFRLVLSDDPSIVLADPETPQATSSPETATSTDPGTSETATSTELADWARLMLIKRIYSTGNNDWIELFNPTDHDFDLAAADFRLEKAVSSQNPSLLMRFGNVSDGYYPGGTIIKAHDTYLIVRNDAGSYYRNQAEAIATRTDFRWDGNGYSFYLGKDTISSSTDLDIIDLVGFGPEASYYEGSGPAPAIPDVYILNRLVDTHNNSTDFNLIASDDPDAGGIDPAINPDWFIPPTPTVSSGLTDLWHFNECYGIGNWVVGKWDCARQFGSRGEAPLKIPLNQALNLNDGFSLSFYYKKSLGAARVKVTVSNAEGRNFYLMTDDSLLQIEGLPNSKFRYYQGMPADYQWHKITLVINQAEDYWEVYVDGNIIVQETFLERLPTMSDIEIGNDLTAVLFDELAVWNRPLSASEIKADYEADAPYSPMPERASQKAAELINFWGFEEDTGQTALDSIGGAVLNLADGAWVGRGHNNYAIKTVAGRLHSGALDNFPQTKDLSLAFWWRDRSDPYNGRANVYLTGGDNNEKNLFAVLVDNFRLDYWFNNGYGILNEGIGTCIPGGHDWHYLTFVYDSYRYKLSFYVDGEEKASTSAIWMPDSEQIKGIKILTDGEESEIDDLSLWKGALSPRQVKEIYTNNK